MKKHYFPKACNFKNLILKILNFLMIILFLSFTENKVIYDDTFGIFYIGGCLDFHPFHGFIGQLTIYRNRIIEPKEVE